jgi:DNA-binding PadR family transcriptional regulator
MPDLPLTPTSYLVLGLIGHFGPCTSYQMKQAVARSIGYFWSFPHSQLYAEPARLAAAGLLREDQEATGRRRRTYTLTPAGRAALTDWLAVPVEEPTELRDLALLKLFFGSQSDDAAMRRQAKAALAAHERRLAEYRDIASRGHAADPYQRRTLDLGLLYEQATLDFWTEVAEAPPRAAAKKRSGQPTRPAPTSASQ